MNLIAVIAVKSGSKEKSMVSFEASKSWEEIAESIDFSNYKVLVGDNELGLRHNLCKEHIQFQLCHHHAESDLGFYLWKDGLPKLARNEFMKPFKEAIYTVQSSTQKYFKDKDKGRLLKRIALANKQIDIIAAKIKERDLPLASEFLERNKKYFFTAAILAIKEDLIVPWTTNQAERLMRNRQTNQEKINEMVNKRSDSYSPSSPQTLLFTTKRTQL